MNIIRKRFKFHGRVQGVGFRYRAEKSASIYGIIGWIRNNDDGTVDMEAQGNRDNIEKMIELIKKGNFIEIEMVEEKNIPLKNDEYGFQILDY